jgi:hypothetical protein
MPKKCNKCGFVTQQEFYSKCVQCNAPLADGNVESNEMIAKAITAVKVVQNINGVRAELRPIREILWSMSPLASSILFSIFFYGLIIMIGIVLFFNKILGYEIELARLYSFTISPLLLLMACCLYFKNFMNKCNKHKLDASRSDLTVAGSTNIGFVERSFKYSDIASIGLGKELNALDDIVGFIKPGLGQMVKDIKDGTLVIILKDGTAIEFPMAYRIFDWRSMAETIRFVRERLNN